jgi:hypothetical protein
MYRLALLAVVLLAACANPMREEAVMEPVTVEKPVAAGISGCVPGGDDGIGGTGCQPD